MAEHGDKVEIVMNKDIQKASWQFTSSRQILVDLRDNAAQKDNLPSQEAINRLIEHIDSGDLSDNDVPIKRTVRAVEEFQSDRITKSELLARLFLWLEHYGAAVRDVGVTDKIAELAEELKAKEMQLATKAITTEIDFTEIPPANEGGGDQDTFELFARDFLDALEYKIVQGPGRGADAGRDLIVVGKKPNGQSKQNSRWLVSCKHFAHSQNKRSVTPDDESNISDRVLQARCDSFMGFYSTLSSSGLITRLEEMKNNVQYGKDYL